MLAQAVEIGCNMALGDVDGDSGPPQRLQAEKDNGSGDELKKICKSKI